MLFAIFASFIGLALSTACTTNSNCNTGYICNTTLSQCAISTYSCSGDTDCTTIYNRCYYCSSSTFKCSKNASCCATNSECGTNYYCSSTSYACEYNTSTTCYSNLTCPSGYYCNSYFNVCQKYCTSSAQCMLGYYCSKVTYTCAINYSFPLPCNSKISCAEGYACEDSVCKYVKANSLLSKEGLIAFLVPLIVLIVGSFAAVVAVFIMKRHICLKRDNPNAKANEGKNIMIDPEPSALPRTEVSPRQQNYKIEEKFIDKPQNHNGSHNNEHFTKEKPKDSLDSNYDSESQNREISIQNAVMMHYSQFCLPYSMQAVGV